MITRKSSTTKKKDKDRLSFQFGLSGFLSLAVLVVIGMAWSFILGVIVGRGYQPEKMAMEMAQKVLPEDFPLLTEKNEEILKGEELEFFEKLKQGPSSVPPAPAPQAKAAPPVPKPPAPETPKPADAQAPKPPQSPIEAALQSAAVAAGQAPSVARETKGEVFVFNYQVAALASMEQAQTFLKTRPRKVQDLRGHGHPRRQDLVPGLCAPSRYRGFGPGPERAAQRQRNQRHSAALPHPALIAAAPNGCRTFCPPPMFDGETPCITNSLILARIGAETFRTPRALRGHGQLRHRHAPWPRSPVPRQRADRILRR